MRTPALSWVTWSATFDFCHRSPHLHMFLLPVVCHSPPVVGIPPQTGSCNPTLGPLRLEGHGLYLNKGENANFYQYDSQITTKTGLLFEVQHHIFLAPTVVIVCCYNPRSLQLSESSMSHQQGLWNEDGVIVIQHHHWKHTACEYYVKKLNQGMHLE